MKDRSAMRVSVHISEREKYPTREDMIRLTQIARRTSPRKVVFMEIILCAKKKRIFASISQRSAIIIGECEKRNAIERVKNPTPIAEKMKNISRYFISCFIVSIPIFDTKKNVMQK